MIIAKVHDSNKLIVQDGKICSTCCYPRVEPIYYCCCFLEPYPSEYTNWANNVFYPYLSKVKYQNKFYFCINTNGAFNIAPSNSSYWKLWDGCGRGNLGSTPKRCSIKGTIKYYDETTYTNYDNCTGGCGNRTNFMTCTASFSGSVYYNTQQTCVWNGEIPVSWSNSYSLCPGQTFQCQTWQTISVSLYYNRAINKTFLSFPPIFSNFSNIFEFNGCPRGGGFGGRYHEGETNMNSYGPCGLYYIHNYTYHEANVSYDLFHNL